MKILVASAILLVLSTAAVRAARADGCRGSGGGASSSAGGGGTSDGSSSSCDEVSDVVGHQRCARFGAGWAGRAGLPAFATEIGFFTRQLDPGLSATGVMEHDTASFSYQVASDHDAATAAGAAVRLSMALPAHLYVGADLEIGGLVSGGAADVEMTGGDSGAGAPTMGAGERLYVSAGGVAGVRGRLGRMALSAEVVAGARDVSLSVKSRHGSCVLSDTHHRTAAFAEPRVRLDLWLSPWVTIAGFAGSDLDGDSRMIGGSVAFHVRAFDSGL